MVIHLNAEVRGVFNANLDVKDNENYFVRASNALPYPACFRVMDIHDLEILAPRGLQGVGTNIP